MLLAILATSYGELFYNDIVAEEFQESKFKNFSNISRYAMARVHEYFLTIIAGGLLFSCQKPNKQCVTIVRNW